MKLRLKTKKCRKSALLVSFKDYALYQNKKFTYAFKSGYKITVKLQTDRNIKPGHFYLVILGKYLGSGKFDYKGLK